MLNVFLFGPYSQNGTSEEVKKIVSILNDGKVASADVVGMVVNPMILIEYLWIWFGNIHILFALFV